jgi:hypothetical protein
MQLFTADYGYPPLDSETVTRRGARKLYYVHDGRNAWHSTWVQRYSEGCMHSTLESAQRYSENKRVQGSVFYILELPAVVFQGESLALAITQINTKEVLADYSPNLPRSGIGRRFDPTGNVVVLGSPLARTHRSFDPPRSWFWRQDPPREHWIIRVIVRGQLKDFESAGRGRMRIFKSFARGSEYTLGWTPSSRTLNTKHVHRIVRSRVRKWAPSGS